MVNRISHKYYTFTDIAMRHVILKLKRKRLDFSRRFPQLTNFNNLMKSLPESREDSQRIYQPKIDAILALIHSTILSFWHFKMAVLF